VAALAVMLATLMLAAGCAIDTRPTSRTPASAATPARRGELGHVHGLAPVGDGTRPYQFGYRLTHVRLPDRAGRSGQLAFVVQNQHGDPQRLFRVEQARPMHVYVVRRDLAVFRHVHPRMIRDGTWRAELRLPRNGRYRVVTEFVAQAPDGLGDHMLLGASDKVGGRWRPEPLPPVARQSTASGVTVEQLSGTVRAGVAQRLRLRIRRADGAGFAMGRYLGAYAHVTGVHRASGSVVHLHPVGVPRTSSAGADLTLVATFPRAGHYRLFVQARVDGRVRTVPVTMAAL